jgi:hypothetical protein
MVPSKLRIPLNSVPLPRKAVISDCSGVPEPFFNMDESSLKTINNFLPQRARRTQRKKLN